jgi:hypothetical protein
MTLRRGAVLAAIGATAGKTGKWRRKDLKTLIPRWEMVWPRKP